MNFQSEDALAEHVLLHIVPSHNAAMRGRRGGASRRKARVVSETEARDLVHVAWTSKHNRRSREQAVEKMKANYGFIEWLFFGWQIYQVIMEIVKLLYPEDAE